MPFKNDMLLTTDVTDVVKEKEDRDNIKNNKKDTKPIKNHSLSKTENATSVVAVVKPLSKTDASPKVAPLAVVKPIPKIEVSPLTAEGEHEKIMKLTEKGMWMCKRPDGTFFDTMIPEK